MDGTTLEDWFKAYARISLGPDPEALASLYAESFLAAGPVGSAAFQNNDDFLQWLRQVHDFNQEAGIRSMDVIGVDETPISNDFILATVQWEGRFDKTGDTPIRFSISYILNKQASGPRIVAYISHEDQEEAMKRYGLL